MTLPPKCCVVSFLCAFGYTVLSAWGGLLVSTQIPLPRH